MTDDIFDYFSGSSNRKVEPIDDEDDQADSSSDRVGSDALNENDDVSEDNFSVTSEAEEEHAEISSSGADSADEKVSHWDRLLGKLGIAPAAKATEPPKSVELPTLSEEEKAARALKRKEREKTRSQEVQPFGGIAAPPGSKPLVKPEASPVKELPPAETVSKAFTEPKKPRSAKQDRPAAKPQQFGAGILDDEFASAESEPEATSGTETLADLFTASENFEPPFEEDRRQIDDVDTFPADELEPATIGFEEASVESPELDDDFDAGDAEFIEYEVQDLDFADSAEGRPRRPSRRDRARRSRSDQAAEEVPEPQTRSRRRRDTRDQDDGDLDSQQDESAVVESDSTAKRGRRRPRGRGSRESRPPREVVVDRVDLDDDELGESLDVEEREEFDDRSEVRGRARGRRPRSKSRRPREEAKIQDEDDLDLEPSELYDDTEPEPARATGRRRPTRNKELESDSPGKRPQIPTWSDAVTSMVELNLKSRGSKPAGRGRGPRRPRRR